MQNQRVVFRDPLKNDCGQIVEYIELEGVILDKYRDMSDSLREYPCDYYLVELNDKTITSIHPYQVVRRI